jgi:hypothetical protein
MLKLNHVLRSPDDEAGGGAAVATPSASPTTPATPAATAAPVVKPVAATPAATSAPVKQEPTWPDNWRETVSKADAKKLAQLQRYASVEAMGDALFAAQERIRSGELKPVLNAKATPEELAEWREAHGIPITPDKYDLKDVKIDDSDKPMLAEILKAAHESNQTPEQVAATVKTWNQIKQAAFDNQAIKDKAHATATEDTLRAEWGSEFRRNMNLIHGLLDMSGSQEVKDTFLASRMPNGVAIGNSPEMLKLLVGLSLINNPTGVVVPGGGASTGEGVREQLTKLQQIPTAKKTQAQSEQQIALIDAASNGYRAT